MCSQTARALEEGEASFGSDRVTDKAWRADKNIAGGGVVLDGGSHTIRPMRMLMQPHCGNGTQHSLSCRYLVDSVEKVLRLRPRSSLGGGRDGIVGPRPRGRVVHADADEV